MVVVGGGVLTMLCDMAANSLLHIEGDDIPYSEVPVMAFAFGIFVCDVVFPQTLGTVVFASGPEHHCQLS